MLAFLKLLISFAPWLSFLDHRARLVVARRDRPRRRAGADRGDGAADACTAASSCGSGWCSLAPRLGRGDGVQ
ncbi:MAG: hypothetical protein MZV49_07665 [Rhodopseudomonas palustris]|nr:hypothetical protein [Rhodopseudomonas palustris]